MNFKSNLFYTFLTILPLFLFTITTQAQKRPPKNSIIGIVLDENTKTPLEYSNIVLFRKRDSTQVNGTVTNELGKFKFPRVRRGIYYLKISFIGYKSKLINKIKIGKGEKLDIGEIFLEPELFNTDDILITGEKAPISYKLDKKVINVSEMFSSISGNAVDVLENVPSITVDIEGNVSLRGSTKFKVLIDGHQSILQGSEALEQIPASSIESLEIITNPSAKYNPEGTAGIINVKIKKNKLKGLSGIASLNFGNNKKYGGEFLLGYRTNSYDAILALDYNNRNFEVENKTESWTLFKESKYFNNSIGTFIRKREPYGIKGSISFDLSQNDLVTVKTRYGYRNGNRNSKLNLTQWNDIETNQNNFSTTNIGSKGGSYYSVGLSYEHKFDKSGHIIKSDISYRKRNTEKLITYKQLDENSNITEGKKSIELEPTSSIDLTIDYVKPFNEDSRFEAGYRSDINLSESEIDYFLYNKSNSRYEYKDTYSAETKYDNNIHALYLIYLNKIYNLDFQIGFRTEYTDRRIKLNNSNESFTINRFDYFPSAHISYDFGGGNKFMSSYTRRIDRPSGRQLEPFIIWTGPNNVRQGNPSLESEYIDSYELGFQKIFNKSILSAELYYRINNNKSEYVQSVFEKNVTLRTIKNIGKDFSFGTELMLNFNPVSFWNVNLMGNLYNYRVEGELNERQFEKESFNWNIRFNNRLKIFLTTQLQINGFYNSSTVSAQGEKMGYFVASVALKQELFNKKLAITLQARNILGTAKREYISESFDFYRHSEYIPEYPTIMLNVRLNINNYKNKNRGNKNNKTSGDEDEF